VKEHIRLCLLDWAVITTRCLPQQAELHSLSY
jgi:hypothetical protein